MTTTRKQCSTKMGNYTPKAFTERIELLSYIAFVATFTLLILVQYDVNADIQQSIVEIGNVPPEILNVTVEDDDPTFTLTENISVNLECNATVIDYNGEDDIVNATATFFWYGGGYNSTNADDNNTHYTNNTCSLNTTVDADSNVAIATCKFNMTYFANNGTWNCNVTATDGNNTLDRGNDTILIDALVALNVPSTIHFGTVDALAISQENNSNVTNTGNIQIIIGLDGYGRTVGDNLSMNCSSGSTQNISIGYMKYNLSQSAGNRTVGGINFTEFETNYTNLTISQVNEDNYTIFHRQNDSSTTDDAINTTAWRVYIPLGVAGTCTGNIQYTAVVDNTPG